MKSKKNKKNLEKSWARGGRIEKQRRSSTFLRYWTDAGQTNTSINFVDADQTVTSINYVYAAPVSWPTLLETIWGEG